MLITVCTAPGFCTLRAFTTWEDIHHSLSLAPLNGSGYGTEHATAAHCVTAGESNISRLPVLCMLLMEEGGRTIIGNKEKVGPANWTNSIGHDKAL